MEMNNLFSSHLAQLPLKLCLETEKQALDFLGPTLKKTAGPKNQCNGFGGETLAFNNKQLAWWMVELSKSLVVVWLHYYNKIN